MKLIHIILNTTIVISGLAFLIGLLLFATARKTNKVKLNKNSKACIACSAVAALASLLGKFLIMNSWLMSGYTLLGCFIVGVPFVSVGDLLTRKIQHKKVITRRIAQILILTGSVFLLLGFSLILIHAFAFAITTGLLMCAFYAYIIWFATWSPRHGKQTK